MLICYITISDKSANEFPAANVWIQDNALRNKAVRSKGKFGVILQARARKLRRRRRAAGANGTSQRRVARFAPLPHRPGAAGRHSSTNSTRNGNNGQGTPSPEKYSLVHQAAARNFELGVRYFRKPNYEKAKEVFVKLATSPILEIADRARAYLRMCELRLERQKAEPRTAAEFYDLGVAQLNARQVEAAIESLRKSDKLEPNRDHTQYALASAHALLGNTDLALAHLKKAMELRPANRFRARNDEDFASLASDPRFKRLVQQGVFPAVR
jgi:tetratricopeptide (TPR) repeat protein